jgi:acyl-CoA reductase-like NAD-dependent aldehyde dehydrogenase
MSSHVTPEVWLGKACHTGYGDREEVMQVTVFVEQLDEQTYRAETAQPIALVTEGRTRDEAIEQLRA